MQFRGLVQADGRLQILPGSILFMRLDWRSSPPFCFRSPFSSGLDLHLRMATKSWWLEEEAARCRGRVHNLGNGSKRQATWAWLSSRGAGFFGVLCSGKIQVRAAPQKWSGVRIRIRNSSLIFLARFKEEPNRGANFSVFSAQSG